ncbi:splicing factor 45 [Asbolus verrucosus]|uniref:Splicing factor 45 n=1 Tax=Asbolus verrucosus TaxID=1661398 RepID=A0A482V1F5_ASBVE|nr:splicing factor 45 [Asbolus verrucosus]
MSLYDDLDVKARATENVSGWSSGIKLLQSQLQLKKATVTQPKREQQRKVSLAPVIDLKSKREDDDIYPSFPKVKNEPSLPTLSSSVTYGVEYDWNVDDEYDPLWPNEFDKVVKELRENRERENDKEEKRRERKRKSRFSDPEEPLVVPTPQITQPPLASGFAGRWAEEDEEMEPVPAKPRSSGGVAIAPPPSLQEAADSTPIFPNKPQTTSGNFGSSVAAKIMARYGFKEGQGLGKQEQGMASALQVEKTSKRGGRIIHEKEMLGSTSPVVENTPNSQQPSITEIIKNPSKVVLLKNMVGPGEVDDDLEPEVKDECNTKYGEVTSVIIHETQAENPEEAVRIFVEFRRIESAIKAVVDLNGRFFGGRQVKANFYDTEKFDNLQLMD